MTMNSQTEKTQAAGRATAGLSDEHQRILRVVAAVRAECGRVEKGSAPDQEFFGKALDFIKNYADKFHHAKEEKFMFPAAVRNHVMKQEGMDHLLKEHEEARAYVRSMEDALKRGKMPVFYDSAKKLVEHMTHHIKEEENEFFPKIEEGLDGDEDMRVYKEFEAFTNKMFTEDVYKATESFAQTIQDDILGPSYFERMA